MTEADLPPLPPPPPLSNPPTADEHDRMLRYVAEVRARKELLSLDAWRTGYLTASAASRAASQAHADAQAATAAAIMANVETINRLAGNAEPFML